MGDAIAPAIAFGVAVALSPFPIIGIVLILAAPGGRGRGLAFLGGSLAGVCAVGALVLVLESRADASDAGEPATWVSILKLVLAALLLVLAAKKWKGRPGGDDTAELPGWMAATETLTTGRSAAMGVLLSGVNPKNAVLIAAAATSIAGATDDPGVQAVALLVFIVIACAGVALPVAATVLWGERASRVLGRVRDGMLRHNTTITTVILVLIAGKLVADVI